MRPATRSRNPRRAPASGTGQRGATLFVALIMLVVFTLLAVSGVSTSMVSLRVVGNAQSQTEASAAAQLAIERVVDQVTNFQHTSTDLLPEQEIEVSIGGVSYTVAVTLQCLAAAPMPGYSASFAASAPAESYWDITATASAPSSSAPAVVHQGLRVTLSPGEVCPG